MRHHVPVRTLLAAIAAVTLVVAGGASDADAQKKGGVIRVGILGEPPSHLTGRASTRYVSLRTPARRVVGLRGRAASRRRTGS